MLSTKNWPDAVEAFDGKFRGLGFPVHRKAEREGTFKLPSDLTVVSADTHWTISEDIFFQRFPKHLRARAPRLVIHEDGLNDWSVDGKLLTPPIARKMFMTFETVPGFTRLEPRLSDMDVEGVDKEIVFGNNISFFYTWPDLEIREAIFRAYNEYLADLQAKAPGRFYGVGLINYWDMSRVRESLAELKQLGLKTYLLPNMPKGANGAPINYVMPEMEPLWAAVEETGLPACFHVGEFYAEGPGGIATTFMVNFGPFRKQLGELIFGGIFDRHPGLRIVFVEGEINWVPGALQTASTLYQNCNEILEPRIKHHPRHYWHTNCYTTFMHDAAGMRLLDIVGADRVMWTSDYPHQESTWGFTRSAMQEVVELTDSEADARMILGGTAQKLFGI